MNNNLEISVLMCVYQKDDPCWFSMSVASILNQTKKPKEVVLVVDGPVSNKLDKIIMEYEKLPMFKVVRLTTNQGHGTARRIGLEKCSSSLVALMDADDISDINRFSKQFEIFMSTPDLDIVGGIITEFIETPENILGKRVVPETNEMIRQYIKYRCPMNQVTVMFKKKSIEKAGGYLDWYCNEDYYLWLRMYLAKMKFANVQEVLVNVRVGENMYQRRGGWKYFRSEAKLQKYMLSNGVINLPIFFINVFERFAVQILMPNSVRGWFLQKFTRKSI